MAVAYRQTTWAEPWSPPEPAAGTPEAIVIARLRNPGWIVRMPEIGGYGDREIRRAIATLRREGWPITTYNGAYRLATTPEEVDHQIADYYSRIREMGETAAALAATLERMRVACQ